MTEQIEQPAETGPTFGSDTSGMREAARALENERSANVMDPETRTAKEPIDVSSKFREPTEAEIDEGVREVNKWRVDHFRAAEAERQADGRSPTMPAKEAGELLSRLRQHQDYVFGEEMIQQQAEVLAEQTTQAEQVAAQQAQAAQEAQAEHQRQLQAQAQAGAQDYATAGGAFVQQIDAELVQTFPELRSRDDLVRLAQQNPQRFTALVNAAKTRDAVAQQVDGAVRTQREQAARQFTEYAQAEDEKFSASHPELQDRARAREAGDNTMAALKAAGLTEADIANLYRTDRAFRSAIGQKILYGYGRLYAAEQATARHVGRVNNKPPVQRPGTSNVGYASDVPRIPGQFKNMREAATWRAQQVRAQRGR